MAGIESFRSIGFPIRVHAGDSAIARLADEVDRARAKRVFLVCGPSIAHRTSLLDQVREILGDRLAGVFDQVEAGSPLPSVEKGVAKAAEAGADAIVAVGGGSAVVTTRPL